MSSSKRAAVELLAPAGESRAAYAAFAFGADAVYTGLPQFSARAEAVNISAEELEHITVYAHSLPKPRRVYVTLNTLIRQNEIRDLLRTLALCSDCGVDAVIVQDAGVARLARQHFPNLRLHASTQLAIHNLEGVRAAIDLGFKRITLARELTLDEIRSIARHTDAEIEVFLHGALCYSYSGLCLYSALLRGRSGNRGACAYPCRDIFQPLEKSFPTIGKSGENFPHCGFSLREGFPKGKFRRNEEPKGDEPKKFSTPWKTPHADATGGLIFSMKDLAHCAECRTLAASGAVSLKIEGRKKSPLYVAAAVNYYRRLLDGTHGPGGRERAEADLKSIFSRPWTPLYLQSRMQAAVIDPHTTGHRGAPLGTVRKATRHSIRFITALPLELHDGIQVELPGETRPFGFAVEDIRLRDGRRVFEAAPHTEVEVPLPQQAPFIPPDTPLFLASSQAVKKRYRFEVPNPRDLKQRHPLRVKVQFSAQAVAVDAEATAGRFNAKVECRYKGPFEAAKKPDAMRQAVENAFSKLGDSPFTLDSIEQDGAPVFLPVSRLNTIRRDITEQLEQQVQQQRQEWLESVEADVAAAQNNTLEREESSPAQKEFLLKTDQPELILDMLKEGPLPPMTELIVELLDSTAPAIDILRKRLPEDIRLRLALPEVTRGWERDALQRHIRYFLDCGQTDWEISNISGLKFLPEAGLDIQADWPLYALNAQAIAEWQQRGIRRLTLSPEDTLENKTALAEAHPFQLMWAVQSDPPLFISENCPQDIGAGPCTGRRGCGFHAAWIKSRKDETLLLVNRGCRFYTLLEKPILELPPPHLPVIRRADFRLRPYTAETFRRQLDTLFA